MPISRRMFVSATAATTGLALSGLTGELRGLAAEKEGVVPRTARILFNENPLGPSPKALAAIADAGPQFARYPLGEGIKLQMLLRRINGLPYVEPSEELSLRPPQPPAGDLDLVLGVGSSEILDAAAWAYCSQGGNVVEAYPGYSAIGSTASRIPGAEVTRTMVPLDSNFRLDTKAMIEAIRDDTRVVVICNPNNPTGTFISVSEIEAIAQAAPKDALVFVDEAYIEFLDEPQKASALEFAATQPNVLITRTFSKIYGLAGLRVGYGISTPEVVQRLKQHMLGGLAHNMPGILAASAAVDDTEHLQRTLIANRRTQETWAKAFHDVGWKMASTKTCFCWVDVGEDCSALVQFLAQRDVLISGGQRWDLPNFVRISAGTDEENDRLVSGIKAFLAG